MAREWQNGKGGSELGTFLRARRTRVTPEEAGLPAGPGLRRTPGLRREELATLAGVSVDYYVRLERGKEANPSPSVVDALARALRLHPAEHEHLRDLAARAARSAPVDSATPPTRTVRPGIELLLKSLRPFPAYVISRTMDILACNPGGLRLFAGMADWPADQRNVVRYVFLHPAAAKLFDDWDEQLRAVVGRLRALHSLTPDAPDLTDLVAELLGRSPKFADLWERYDVRWHTHGCKTFHHPEVGDLTPGYQSMQLEGTEGQRFIAYYAEPGTPDHDKLVLLDTSETSEYTVDGSMALWPDEDLQVLAVCHGPVAVRYLAEVDGAVEDTARLDPALQDVRQQLLYVGACRGDTAREGDEKCTMLARIRDGSSPA